jgi:uncharacterized membrane protein YvlD (DUF360 family)
MDCPGYSSRCRGPHPAKHDWAVLLIVALIFGALNVVIRPIIVLLSLPLEIIPLGLFTFVINAFMLLLTSWIAQGMGVGFRVDRFLTALLGALTQVMADQWRRRDKHLWWYARAPASSGL